MTTRKHQSSLIIMVQHLSAVLYEDNDCSELLESEGNVFLFAVLSTFMRQRFNRSIGYFEETVQHILARNLQVSLGLGLGCTRVNSNISNISNFWRGKK